MPTWTSDELNQIEAAEELQIASPRRDGTLRNPVIIWVVRLGNDLYVRSAYGRTPLWFRGTRIGHKGRINAGGIQKDVDFEDADSALADSLDAAYRDKCRQHAAQYVDSVVSPDARSTTTRLVPR